MSEHIYRIYVTPETDLPLLCKELKEVSPAFAEGSRFQPDVSFITLTSFFIEDLPTAEKLLKRHEKVVRVEAVTEGA